MNNLQWINLRKSFYEFACEAKEYNFYNDELEKMANSIEEMNPYKDLINNDKK